MKNINHHAGNVIVESQNGNEFLTNIYDDTYPIQMLRNKINFLGGGKDENDFSPRHLIIREIAEEFSLNPETELDEATVITAGRKYNLPEVGQRASEKDINLIKKSILDSMQPLQDYVITFSKSHDELKLTCQDSIFSIFYSKIPQEVFEVARQNISKNKNLVNDGFLKITNYDEIISGKILTAWATGRVLEDFLGVKIQNPEKTCYQKIGAPRASFKEYLKDFKYHRF